MVSQPKSPDPYETAAAQQNANIGSSAASAIINNANENNPYGSVKYSNIGYETVYDAQGKPQKVPRYQRDVTLSPEQQGLLNLSNQTQTNLGQLGVSQSSRLQGLLGQEMNTEGLQDWSTGTAPKAYDENAYAAQRDQVTNALMERYRAQTEPQRQAQEAQLAARGLAPGSQNWGSVQDAQNRQDTDQTAAAVVAGGAEQSRMLSDERAGNQQQQDYASFLNNLRSGQLQERQAVRNQPINEISALMSGSQVTVPQFQQFSRQGVDPAPIGQYINQDYQNKVNAANATNQGLFGLGGAAMGMFKFSSDRRLKKEIFALRGRSLAGLPLYAYRYDQKIYKDLPRGIQIGVMSDEARKLHPDAVHVDTQGYDVVDYGLLLRRH